jgi:hypothetical protein
VIENVTTNNVRTVGILAHDINYGHFDNLSCKTTSGNCFEFGLASGPWGGPREDRDTVIGSLTAENCLGVARNRVGNSLAAVMINLTIHSITATNCAAGIKIQDTSNNVRVDSAFSYGGVNGTNNSGFKVQGDLAGNGILLQPQGVYLGYVYSEGQYGAGLYIVDAINTTVDSYVGKHNGTGGKVADVYVSGTNTKINNILSEDAVIHGVEVGGHVGGVASNYQLGSVMVWNAGIYGMVISKGVGVTDSLTVSSSPPHPLPVRGLNVFPGVQGSVLHFQLHGASEEALNNSDAERLLLNRERNSS